MHGNDQFTAPPFFLFVTTPTMQSDLKIFTRIKLKHFSYLKLFDLLWKFCFELPTQKKKKMKCLNSKRMV